MRLNQELSDDVNSYISIFFLAIAPAASEQLPLPPSNLFYEPPAKILSGLPTPQSDYENMFFRSEFLVR